MTAVIVDDEPLARQELAYLLEQAGGVSVLAEGANGVEAVDLIRTHRPHVVFLDVRMPGLDGFAVLKRLLAQGGEETLPEVVFATAFDQYAVKAFDVNAVDYLLKPFDSKRLHRTLEKVRLRLQTTVAEAPEPAAATVAAATAAATTVPPAAIAADPGASPPPAPTAWPLQGTPEAQASLAAITATAAVSPTAVEEDRGGGPSRARIWDVAQAKLDALLRMVEEQTAGGASSLVAPVRTGRVVVRTGNRLLLVDQKDVCFASTDEGRIRVVTKTLEGDSNVRTLEELAEQLDPGQFWRAHRSFLVNLQHIREVVPWFKSSYQLRMDDRNGTEVPVSRSQTKRLRELFNL